MIAAKNDHDNDVEIQNIDTFAIIVEVGNAEAKTKIDN